MKGIVSASLAVLFGVALATSHLLTGDALAVSGYWTSAGCSGCHSAPVVASCNACHAHGAHPSSAKSGVNITGTTNKTSYAPGETVSVTLAGGYRTGWVGVRLYDQSGNEIARGSSNASGMGGAATFPAVLTAPAPSAPGNYTWKAAWYGNVYDSGSAAFGAGWTVDPNNPDHGQEIVSTNSFTVAAPADTTAPAVSAFTLPATSASLTIPVSSLTATDNVAVTGYIVTTTSAAPAAGAAGWSATAPASVTAAAEGSTTFYAWAKDAAGNVSASRSATVVVTLPDTAAPVVSAFTLPATSASLSIPVSSLTATDNKAVTGYIVTTTSAAPAAGAAGWSATAPASVTAAAEGNTTFYAWAKDAAGNVSASRSATVAVTLPDTAAPVVSAFTLPATSTSLTVPVSSFTATDNKGVTGYLVTTTSAAPAAGAAGWSATAPASVTAAAEGSTTFYAWARDAAGNVSASRSATVVVTLPDTAAPTVSAFTLPASSTSLSIPVSAFTATDNKGVTGYLVTTSSSAPAAGAAGWSATAPANVTAAAEGSTTFYAWAKDAAGNVSASRSATVVVTLPDTAAPVVSAFTLPATSASLSIPVSSLTATDNKAVTGYIVTTSSSAPAAGAAGWSATAPANVTAAAEGSTTFYAWAKDAAGNVSASRSATVVVTLPDTAAPIVSAFALPATSASLSIAVSALSATDNIGVTGYIVTTTSTAPAAGAAGWSATAPASVTAAGEGSRTFYAWARDAAGNVSAFRSATVTVTLPDTAAPSVSAFTLPATSSSLSIAVGALTATDNIGVTGYMITTTSAAPAAGAAGWSATAPASVTAAGEGSRTFYAWARDAAGNVSAFRSATVTVTLPDTAAPSVSAFTLPATSSSLSIAVGALTATDNIGVTGYMITTTSAAPVAGGLGWSASAPASVTAAGEGSVTFYAWAKDAAGNVSASRSATVTVTLPDTAAPAVTAFTVPASADSLTVAIGTFTAADNIGVTGYMITTTSSAPEAGASGWTAVPQANVTLPAAGSTVLYAWAKDAAGNVSASRSATVVVTLPDTSAPVVTSFTVPAASTVLNIAVSAFGATDNVGVTGYMITIGSSAPAADASGWTAAPQQSVTLPDAGSTTLYAWAKDAAGNVSAPRSAAVTVTLPPAPDTSAPVISSFVLPAASDTLTIAVGTLTATDNTAVTGYMITTSSSAPAAAGAGWSASAPASVTAPATGTVTFYAWAKDAAGNVSDAGSATVEVAATDAGPVLSVSTLSDGSVTNNRILNISGNAADADGIKSVTVNRRQVEVSGDGSFSKVVRLSRGKNRITVTAFDSLGNRSSDTRTITYDPKAPLLKIASPSDNGRTSEHFITVTGSINEAASVTVSVNGGDNQSAQIYETTFMATVYLIPGVNTISITATDAAGNISSRKRTVIYDNTSPSLAVTDPDQDITTTSSAVVLKGQVGDELSRVAVTVSVAGKIYKPSVRDGKFAQKIVFGKPGAYAVIVTATDGAGNTTSVTRNIIWQEDDEEDDDL